MAEEFDVIVIGAGPAGENAAGRCSEGGLSTALVEAELVGGECSYWACMPSKALLRPGEVLAAARRVPGAREAVTGELDVDAALARRDRIVHHYDDEDQVKWVEEVGAELVRGHGRLAGERVVHAEGKDGTRRLTARRAVVVATGSAASIPPIPGLRDMRVWDSRAATAAKQVPRRLLVLGDGVVAVELGQAWKRLGAEAVTIVSREGRLLSREEPFAGVELRQVFEAEGIEVRCGTTVAACRRAGKDGPVTLTLDDGSALHGDELLVAAGRRPRTGDLGLDTVGLEPGGFVDVDDQLRASGVPGGWLYAIGDANGRALLTHQGKYQARLCADHILGKHVEAFADHRAVPRVMFTDPQVAAVGLTEQQARDQGIKVKVVTYPTGNVAGSAVAGQRPAGTSQLVVDEDRKVVVGATFTGYSIAELLHSATVAVVGEVPLERLWHAVPSFPTVSEVWLRLLESYGL
ncbi:MAG TPA: NAD(P)/FAD-dependent oxidoreductase [Actinomycetes bacterium]|jgi:dihydrolipoamide dehydrogenase|nr:NAD(P)/FAD-dependent oxidoreductase [Actinomycetes bacterium]